MPQMLQGAFQRTMTTSDSESKAGSKRNMNDKSSVNLHGTCITANENEDTLKHERAFTNFARCSREASQGLLEGGAVAESQ